MDISDYAYADEARAFCLAAAPAEVNAPAPDGKCLHCGAAVGLKRRWCDVECKATWVLLHPGEVRGVVRAPTVARGIPSTHMFGGNDFLHIYD